MGERWVRRVARRLAGADFVRELEATKLRVRVLEQDVAELRKRLDALGAQPFPRVVTQRFGPGSGEGQH
jgi:hypothetical protein